MRGVIRLPCCPTNKAGSSSAFNNWARTFNQVSTATCAVRPTGTTRVFLIVGDPVAQVKAPQVYNHLFAQNGIDAVLVPMKVPPGQLGGFVRNAFAAQNVGGMWVTIPHKSGVHDLLDHCDPLGRTAGAVNAVRRRPDGTLEGALFDGSGTLGALIGRPTTPLAEALQQALAV